MTDTVLCPACRTENEMNRKFCGECGAALAPTCASCGSPNPPGVKFCGECGAALVAATFAPTGAADAQPAAERRLVSVLFADLVGFTALSETRDAEDVRELLTSYFDTARTVIERYGGTVEKFIGDAVMAVWGAPIAQEDDAERAVRAALELIGAISALGEEVGAAELRLRAGIQTGEAAVNVGAEGQGMVAGDLVNTASRVQSAAEPGTVLVGEATRRASEAAIAYEDAGEHELRGKADRVPLWRALRVVASRGGEGRSAGLEAPFVGRDPEFRLIKNLFHATDEERKARLVAVVGVAGIGKSRLSWEFEKYMDGLAQTIWWHRGRCLAYGDGVAYWALAEMVRGRIGALEDDDPSTTTARLSETVAKHFDDPEERDWIEERLRHLVGLSDRAAADREDLFPAWRRFFERLAEQGPLVLVFEDLHWADGGLVSFIEHILDWSRNHSIFVLTLARAEIAERHPGFPGATRNATTLPLDPLTDASMDELLRGLVPGLPDETRARIREQAGGIPLYAVETVRMLLDRGLLEPAGSEYRLTGPVETLAVPETLHALIAARLDGLPESERRLLQDASVLGKTFTRRGLAALSGLNESEIEPSVASLVGKEVFYLETDRRSPERGQYGFLQALVQHVAYETLSRRERRSRHLAAADFLSRDSGMDASEIAEVIAAHYLDAYEADRNASDADEVRALARGWFVRAAERSFSLAAAAEAQRGFERAASLAGGEVEGANLLCRAGDAAVMAGDLDAAERLFADAIAAFGRTGLAYEEAQTSSKLAEALYLRGKTEEAVEHLQHSLGVLEAGEDEGAVATVSVQLGRFLFFEGQRDNALRYTERALELGERLRLPEVVSQALNTKALVLENRPYESLALMRGALDLALEHDLGRAAIRGFINLGYLLWITGASFQEIERVSLDGLAYARRRGDRASELNFVGQAAGSLFLEGRWDELHELVGGLPEEATSRLGDAVAFSVPVFLADVARHRGDDEAARALMVDWAALKPSADVQVESCRIYANAVIALTERRCDEVLRIAREELASAQNPAAVEGNLQLGSEAAELLGAVDELAELLRLAEDAQAPVPPSSVAQRARLGAKLSALRGDDEPAFARAVAVHRESGERFWLAATLLEQAEWLMARGRGDEAAALLAEARETFERLRAEPWLERLERAEQALDAARVSA
jgi:class 3 adenylate cyclase/tetratricopeptide (TPR) repeat protein